MSEFFFCVCVFSWTSSFFFLWTLSWSSACFLEQVLFSQTCSFLHVFLFSYFLFYYYKFPALTGPLHTHWGDQSPEYCKFFKETQFSFNEHPVCFSGHIKSVFILTVGLVQTEVNIIGEPSKGHVQPLPRGASLGAREAGRGGSPEAEQL